MRTNRTRMMAWVASGAVLLLGFALAGSASAASISLIWTATSGAGVGVGTSSLTGVAPGDTATLDIVVNPQGAGLQLVAVDLSASAGIAANSGVECPAGPNTASTEQNGFAGFCQTSGVFPAGNYFQPLTPGVSIPSIDGNTIGQFDAGSFTSSDPAALDFTLGQAVFTANASGQVQVVYGQQGGYNDGAFNTLADFTNPNGIPLNPASISLVPEPTTAALMALGLGTLAWVGRRRQS